MIPQKEVNAHVQLHSKGDIPVTVKQDETFYDASQHLTDDHLLLITGGDTPVSLLNYETSEDAGLAELNLTAAQELISTALPLEPSIKENVKLKAAQTVEISEPADDPIVSAFEDILNVEAPAEDSIEQATESDTEPVDKPAAEQEPETPASEEQPAIQPIKKAPAKAPATAEAEAESETDSAEPASEPTDPDPYAGEDDDDADYEWNFPDEGNDTPDDTIGSNLSVDTDTAAGQSDSSEVGDVKIVRVTDGATNVSSELAKLDKNPGGVFTDKSVVKSSSDELGFDETLTVYGAATTGQVTEEDWEGNYIIIIDTTTSMARANLQGKAWNAAIAAANRTVKQISASRGTNRVMVTSFSCNNNGSYRGGNPSTTVTTILPMANYADCSGDPLSWNPGPNNTKTYSDQSAAMNSGEWWVSMSPAALSMLQKQSSSYANKPTSDYRRYLGNGTWTAAAIAQAGSWLASWGTDESAASKNVGIILMTDGVANVGYGYGAMTSWSSSVNTMQADKFLDDGGSGTLYSSSQTGIPKLANGVIKTAQYWKNLLNKRYNHVEFYSAMFMNGEYFDNSLENNYGIASMAMWMLGVSNDTYMCTANNMYQIQGSAWPATNGYLDIDNGWFNGDKSYTYGSVNTTYHSDFVKAAIAQGGLPNVSPFIGVFSYTAKLSGSDQEKAISKCMEAIQVLSARTIDKTVLPLKSGTDLVMITETAQYMTVKGAPTITYRGKEYKGTESGGTYTYTIGNYKPTIKVTTSGNVSKLIVTIPADLVNANGLSDFNGNITGKNRNPITVKFHSSLFSDDYEAVRKKLDADKAAGWNAGKAVLTTYTNNYTDHKTTVTYTTDINNTAYGKTDKITAKKSQNTTGTLDYISYTDQGLKGKQTTVTLGNNGKLELTFLPGIKVQKVVTNLSAYDGYSTLAGYVFRLTGTSADGKKVDVSATTNAKGLAEFRNVPVGSNYTLTEVSVPDHKGRSLEKAPWWDAVNDPMTGISVTNSIITITRQNIFKTGNLEVTKEVYDASGKYTSTAGYVFRLSGTSDSGDPVNLTQTTNASGKAVFSHVPVGTYTLTEVGIPGSASVIPAWWDVVEKSQQVTISYDEENHAEIATHRTVSNIYKTGNLEVTKTVYDASGKYPDATGFVFTLTGTSHSGEKINQTATTDKNGKTLFVHIPIGTYMLTETGTPDSKSSIPAWWDALNVSQQVQITWDDAAHSENTAKAGAVNYHKTGNVKITKTIETVESLGITDEYNKSAESVENGNHYNEKLSGFAFHLTGASDSGETVDVYAVTDNEGVAVFPHIPIGTKYTVTEVKASDLKAAASKGNASAKAIQAQATQELYQYYIKSPTMENIAVRWYDYASDHGNWGKDALDQYGERATALQFENKLKKWSFSGSVNGKELVLSKNDQDTRLHGEAQNYARYVTGDAVLEGAVYGLYDGGKLVATAATDKNGDFTFRGKNGYYIVGDEWYIQEITPSEGYNLDPTKYHVDACALGGESGLKDHKDEGTITNAEYHVAETHAYVSGAAKGAYGGSNTVREDEITQPVAVRKYKSDNSTKITPLAGAGFTVYLKRELDQFISTTSWRTTEFKDGTEDYYTRFFEAVTNGEVTAGRQAVTLSAIPVAKKYVDGNGPTAIPEFFTDSTGYGYSVPLNYGDYVMYETTVPNDQIGAAEACLFSIRGVNEKSTSTPLDLSEDYSILDPIYQTKLVLVKKDADTGETILKPGTQWLIYEVKDNGSLGGLIVQKDSTTNTFYGTESNPWTVDETGTITMLEPLTASSKYNTGRYYLAEVNAPEGYYNEYAAQGKPLDGFYFGIGNSMRYERRYYLSAGDGTYTTDPNLPESEYLHSGDHRVYDEISVVEYANPETRGVVTIEKRGEKLSTYGSSDLLHTVSDFFGFSDSRDFIYVEGNVDGAVYSIIAAEDIYAQDGHKTKWASAGDVVATVTTGASDTGDSISIGCDGIVTASHDKDGRVTLTLPLGRYTIREVQAPAGYVLDETEQTVEFVWDSQKDEYVYDVSGAADKDGVVSFFNERARGYGELLKVDSFDGAPMANVTFQLYTVDDIFNYKGERIVKADTLLGEVTTGEDGTLRTALGLPIAFEGSQNTGRYYFVEKETPRGYAENAAKYEFVLSYVDQKTPEIVSRIDAKNDPIPPEFNITKAVDMDTLQVRDCQDGKGDLTYTITVTNDKGIGKGAYITDTFDSYLKITDVSLTRNETQHEMAEKDGTAPYTYNVNHVGMFTFYVGDIYEGDTVTLTVHARVRNNIPAGTDILNKAFVDSPNNYADRDDPSKGTQPKESNEVKTVVIGPILRLVKKQSLNGGERTKERIKAHKGDVITYYLTVTNKANATSDAFDVTINDPIPHFVSFMDGSASEGGVYDPAANELNWPLGTLKIGERRTVSFKVEVTTDLPNADWVNIASADASNGDRVQDDVDDGAARYRLVIHYVNTEGQTILADYVLKDAEDSSYDVSSLIHDTVGDYKKVGSGDFGKYTTANGIADGSAPVKGVLDGDKVIIIVYDRENDPGKPGEGQNTVIIHYVDKDGNAIAPDEVRVADKGSDYDVTGSIPNSIGDYTKVGTGEYGKYETTDGITNDSDPTSGKLDGDKVITVVYETDGKIPSNPVEGEVKDPDLHIVKEQARNGGDFTTSGLGVSAGDTVTYKLIVTNSEDAGASANDTAITDKVPDGLTLVEGSVSDGGTVKDGEITWNVGALAIGESKNVTFKVKVPTSAEDATYRNVAYTHCSNQPTPEPKPSNEVEAVVGGPNVLTEKLQQVNGGERTKEPQIVKPGDVVTYSIVVSNPRVEDENTGAAHDLVVTDPIPNGLTLVDGSVSDEGTVSGNTITWKIAELPVDGSIELSFRVTVPATSVECTYKNVATIKDKNPDDPQKPEPEIKTNEVIVEEPVPVMRVLKTQAVNGGMMLYHNT